MQNAAKKRLSLTCRLIAHGSPDYEEAVALRRRLLRTPLGLDFAAEELAAEHDALHAVAYDADGVCRGTLMAVTVNPECWRIRQVAVDTALQGQGIGRLLNDFIQAELLSRGATHAVLNARSEVIPFYRKLGFETVGTTFIEIGIPHCRMEKTL